MTRLLYFWDRSVDHGNNDSLYFTDQGWGAEDCRSRFGIAMCVSSSSITATYYLNEFHVDGFRYDEVSKLVQLNGDAGWRFCQDLTNTVRFINPHTIQNAEYWPVDPAVIRDTSPEAPASTCCSTTRLRMRFEMRLPRRRSARTHPWI